MHYLLCYDVQEDKPRTTIMKFLKDCGYHLQKSVFLLHAEQRDEVWRIYQTVVDLTDPRTDRVFLTPLCQTCIGQKLQSGTALDCSHPVWIV